MSVSVSAVGVLEISNTKKDITESRCEIRGSGVSSVPNLRRKQYFKEELQLLQEHLISAIGESVASGRTDSRIS